MLNLGHEFGAKAKNRSFAAKITMYNKQEKSMSNGKLIFGGNGNVKQ